jgi:hypothetical protein
MLSPGAVGRAPGGARPMRLKRPASERAIRVEPPVGRARLAVRGYGRLGADDGRDLARRRRYSTIPPTTSPTTTARPTVPSLVTDSN